MNLPVINTETKQWETHLPVQLYYSILEVSHLCWVSTPQLYGEIRRGSLRSVTVNDVISLEHDELLRYIANKKAKRERCENPEVKPHTPSKLKGVERPPDTGPWRLHGVPE